MNRANRLDSASPIATSCSPTACMSSISRRRSRQTFSALRPSSRARVSAASSGLPQLVGLAVCRVAHLLAFAPRCLAGLLGLALRRGTDPLRLLLGLLEPIVGPGTRAGRDLLCRLVRAQEDVARLIAHLVE